jgi:hypothetical protein
MAGDAATSAAESVRPKKEELNQLDSPAPDNTWYDAPDMSRAALKGRFHHYSRGESQGKMRTATAESTSQDQPASSSDPGGLTMADGHQGHTDSSSGVDAAGAPENGSKDKIETKKDEYRERVKNYFSSKMPQERREQAIWRLKVCPLNGFPLLS